MTKPPYRIPLMTEIAKIPFNGLTVASTFSGCGGSCLGFRWAGFKHVYANEFIPAARDTYRANFPGYYVDDRDIRNVSASDVLKIAKLKPGQLDVLEGSPPCSSFSTAGKGAKGWGEVKKYSDSKQRTDDLFYEFLRLLTDLQPRMFVAENVAGLVRGAAKGYFIDIMSRMTSAGYVPECRILDAQWLGVPQSRRRTIFVGVRKDLASDGMKARYPDPMPHRYSIADALTDLQEVIHDTGGQFSNGKLDLRKPINTITVQQGQGQFRVRSRVFGGGETNLDTKAPAPTLMALGMNGVAIGQVSVEDGNGPRKFTIAELRRLGGFPDDFALTGTYQQQWERIGRAVPPPMMRAVAAEVAKTLGAA